MTAQGAIDPRDFRKAASHFATGVTVITTTEVDGSPTGLTANSFTTVSLHPPMVLFCLGEDSSSAEAFDAASAFAVHVLAADQVDEATRFAAKGIDRFAGVAWHEGHGGVPVLDEALAVFECDVTHRYPGGDHVIIVGTVVHLTFAPPDAPALGYFRGRYVELS